MNEARVREAIVELGRSLFARGLTFGSTGNISVSVDDGWILTPTNRSLGSLDPAALSKIDASGRHISGEAPTKELLLHQVMYDERPSAGAVVHLHSTYSVAVSCLANCDHDNVFPPITAYQIMRLGRVPLVPYFAPGDADLAEAVRPLASKHHALLLANHGPVVAGSSLSAAAGAIEELEETARLHLLLQHHPVRHLTDPEVDALTRKYGAS
jgi:ribulose-5-phosphate 4-epimerase/fuculose-1-phosphate aldolase